jgi:hypothetical protein
VATFKLTWKRGQRAQHVVKAAGSAIAGSDAIEVNIDTTNMSKSQVLQGLDYIKQQILEKGFPQ